MWAPADASKAYLDSLARPDWRPPADDLPAVADFGTAFREAWDDTRYRLLGDSAARNLSDAYDRMIEEVHRATGERLGNPVLPDGGMANPIDLAGDAVSNAAFGHDWTWSKRGAQAQAFADWDARAADLAQRFPDLKIKSRDELEAEIAAEGRRLHAQRLGGERSGWGDFLGETGAHLTDPINIATMLVGSPAAVRGATATLADKLRHVGRVAAVEGGMNAGIEAITQPSVFDYNRRLGVPYSAEEAAGNVAMAGIGGAALGGGVAAAGLGLKGLLGRWKAAKAAGLVAKDGDTRAAETVAEAALHRIESNPFPGAAGAVAHTRAMDEATEALLAGRPVDVSDIVADEQRQLLEARRQARSEVAALRADPDMPPGPASEVLASLSPETMAGLVVEVRRGPAVRDGGVLSVPTRGSEGMIKIEIKHPDVTDAELMALPQVLRAQDYEIVGAGGDTMVFEWRRHFDGAELVYRLKARDKPKDEGKLYLVTIFRNTDPGTWKGETPWRGPAAPGPHGSTGHFDRDTTQAFSVQSPGGRGQPALNNIAPDAAAHHGPEGDMPPAESVAAPVPKRRRSLPPSLREPNGGKRPETLSQWLRRQGGIQDADGELAHMGVTAKSHIGLVRKTGGLNYDEAALRAWEAGYLHGENRPTVAEFLDALDGDIRGHAPAIARDEQGIDLDWEEWRSRWHEVDRAGIDPRGLSDDDLSQAMAEFYRRQAGEQSRGAEGMPAHQDGPERASIEAEQIAAAERLVADTDLMVPRGDAFDADGKPVLESARKMLADADFDLETAELLRICSTG